MKNVLKNSLRILILFSLVVGATQIFAAGPADGTNVKVMILSPQHLKVYKSYVGYIKPVERVTVKVETAGTVEMINVAEGDTVKAGQVLAHVSTEEAMNRKNMSETSYLQALTDYNTQKQLYRIAEDRPTGNAEHISISQLRLQYNLTKTQYENALREFKTQKQLYEKQMVSEDIIESYRTNLKTKEIQMQMSELDLKKAEIQDLSRLENYSNVVNIRKAELNLARLELDKSQIKAPFDGVVNQKLIQMGGFIQKAVPAFEIMDISDVIVQINIPEQEIVYAREGKKIAVRLDALPGKKFYGELKTVGLESDIKTRSFPAEVIIKNESRDLLPGMMAKTVMLAVSKQNQVVVPRHAVLERDSGSIVFVEKNGVAMQKRVRTGHMVNENVQVTSGLKIGDRLIVVGQDLLTNNEAVNVANEHQRIVRK